MGESVCLVRAAVPGDVRALMEIYNHYVVESHATFDLEPVDEANRKAWMAKYGDEGLYRLLVAVESESQRVVGYATSSQMKARAAYDTSIEVSVYLAPDATGQGIGCQLYEALFAALEGQPIHRAYAGVAMPNPASEAIHRRFGFVQVGLFSEVGYKFGRYWDVTWWERAMGGNSCKFDHTKRLQEKAPGKELHSWEA